MQASQSRDFFFYSDMILFVLGTMTSLIPMLFWTSMHLSHQMVYCSPNKSYGIVLRFTEKGLTYGNLLFLSNLKQMILMIQQQLNSLMLTMFDIYRTFYYFLLC